MIFQFVEPSARTQVNFRKSAFKVQWVTWLFWLRVRRRAIWFFLFSGEAVWAAAGGGGGGGGGGGCE
jgi:hypothetical protein